MKQLSIVIPVYYNETSLPEMFTALQELEGRLKERDIGLELIFVDDASGDGSFAELLKFRAQRPTTKIIKHSRNFGAVRAVKTGLRYVGGDCFTFLAADLQDPPELVEQMAALWQGGAKYVVCVRRKRDDPVISRFFSALYYKILRAFVVKEYPDGGFDLALMDRIMLPYLLHGGKNINLSLFAHSLGFHPATIHYDRRKRQHGTSRWTFAKKANYLIDSLLGFSILPIRIFSLFGIVLAILSFGYGVVVVVSVLAYGSTTPGFAALATLLSFLSGLFLVMLGIIGEYIWRIFDQINGTPEAVIETALTE